MFNYYLSINKNSWFIRNAMSDRKRYRGRCKKGKISVYCLNFLRILHKEYSLRPASKRLFLRCPATNGFYLACQDVRRNVSYSSERNEKKITLKPENVTRRHNKGNFKHRKSSASRGNTLILLGNRENGWKSNCHNY